MLEAEQQMVDKNCSDCLHGDDCKIAYEQLGKFTGPSVAVKALVAFLLPLGVFIASLALFGRIFKGVIENRIPLTALSFVCALVVTLAYIFAVRFITIHIDKRKHLPTEHCQT
jgi:uncharacterized protein YqhQ